LYENYFLSHGQEVNSLEQILNSRQYYFEYYLSLFLPKEKNTKILDLGCGYGTTLACLNNLGYSDFIGVDSSKEAINLLRSTYLKEKVIEANIVDFLKQAVEQGLIWDVVLAIDILEHFTKDELVEILLLLKPLISPSGRLIIKIPNMQSPLLSGGIVFGDFTHEIYVTPDSLGQVLTACGFDSISNYEASPVPHTSMSKIRYILWKIVRVFYTFIYAIEAGIFDNSMIWSRSFFCIAKKS
jgi:SAM-dependent methyltransferase